MASTPVEPPAREAALSAPQASTAKDETTTDPVKSPLGVMSLPVSPPLDSYKTPLSSPLEDPEREPTDYPLPASPTEPVQSTLPLSDRVLDATKEPSSNDSSPIVSEKSEQPSTVRSSVLNFVKPFLPDSSIATEATKVPEAESESDRTLESVEPKEFNAVKTASSEVTSLPARDPERRTKEVTKSSDPVEPSPQLSETFESTKTGEKSPDTTIVSSIMVVKDATQPSSDATLTTPAPPPSEITSLVPGFSFDFDIPKEDTTKPTTEHLELIPETTKTSPEPGQTMARAQTAPLPSRRSSTTSSPSPTPLKSSTANDKIPQPSQSSGCGLFSCFGSSKSQPESSSEAPRPVSKPVSKPASKPAPPPLVRSRTSVISAQRGTNRQLPNLIAVDEKSALSSSKDSTPRNSANGKQRLSNIDEKELKVTRQYTDSVDSIEELKAIKALQQDIEKQVPLQKLSTRDRKELGVDEDTLMNFYI